MAIGTEDLTVFLAVARHGSFGRAAAALFVSQPAVSERIARLERVAGATLFHRGARGTTMTEAGERLLPYAQRVTGLLEEARAAVASDEARPPLRVGVHVTFAHRVLDPVMAALGEEERGVEITDAHSEEVVAMLLDGLVDIGFVLPDAPPPPALTFVPMPADPVVAVCAAGHPLTRRGTVGLAALRPERVALNRWGSGAASFLAKLAAAGVGESRWTHCSDAVTALRLARHHRHVAFVTASIAAEDVTRGALARLTLRPAPRWSVPLVFAHRARDHDDPTIAAVLASLAGLRRS